jgi:uridylate kinase
VLLKATRVDGIYTADPEKDGTAQRYRRLDYHTALERELQVMDSTAFALCKENGLPIIVFNLDGPGNIELAVRGQEVGTLVAAGQRPGLVD